MNPDEYGTLIEERAVERDGRRTLPCAVAFDISRKHGIQLKDIGAYCTENGIKIIMCQLGCFE